jgi:DNA-binding XRE family transcriptional regulator
VKSRELREKIGLSRTEWAHALNITVRTVERWEDESHEPTGIAVEVMRGIADALAEPRADPARIGRAVSRGIASLLFHVLAHL